uniref:Uncharacterized protein n=1 Tax=Panagrolaimus superbus TaxID=310955 RepID=A0A914YSW8_9BILA
MAEVIQGETVFDDASGERSIIYNKIMNDAPVIKIQDNDAKDFFSHLLQKQPSARLKQILQHQFFRNVSKSPLLVPGEFFVNPSPDESSAEKCPEKFRKAILEKKLILFPTKERLHVFK